MNNELELICLKCGHKAGWHHGRNPDGTMTKCYGIACECSEFNHNLCCLEPLFEVIQARVERKVSDVVSNEHTEQYLV